MPPNWATEGAQVEESKWERWSALGGIAFVILLLVTFFLPGTPPKTSDDAAKMVKFITDKHNEIRISTYIGTLAVVFLFWWLGAVWRLMRRAEGGSPRLAVVALSGGIFASAMAAVGGILLGVMPIVGANTLGTGGTKTFYILSTNIGISSLFGAAVFLAAFSALIIRSGVMPALLGWAGAVIAVVALVGGVGVSSTKDAVFTVAYVGFLAFLAWVLVVAVMMWRTPSNG